MLESDPWRLPLPKLFWSEYHNGPFPRCIDCDVPLLETDAYFVQRNFVGSQPVFEMAMCHSCQKTLSEQCSKKTTTAVNLQMMAWLLEGVGQLREFESAKDVLGVCIDSCIGCRQPRIECHRFATGGLCTGQDLIVHADLTSRSPFVICENCQLEVSELISEKTRDVWDRFMEQHFDGPPGIDLDVPTGSPILI